MSRKPEMLTITQLIEQGKTTYSKGHLQKLIHDGAITGVEVVGKTFLIPLTKANLKVISQRQRREKTSQKNNNDAN